MRANARTLGIVALLGAAALGLLLRGGSFLPAHAPVPAAQDAVLARAIESQQRDVLVEGEGTVIRVLPDDRDGSRHQRFIIRLASGQTLLIAHNIDLAPRVEALAEGDRITFRGEYEWNPKGGVIHWTHHDPAGRHPGGWIRHRGKLYQ